MILDMPSRALCRERKVEEIMSKIKDFLKRKDIVITPQRYLIEALGAMAQASRPGWMCWWIWAAMLRP